MPSPEGTGTGKQQTLFLKLTWTAPEFLIPYMLAPCGNSTSNYSIRLQRGAPVFLSAYSLHFDDSYSRVSGCWRGTDLGAGKDLLSDAENRLHGSITSMACSLQQHLQTRLTMPASESSCRKSPRISWSRDIAAYFTFYLHMGKNRQRRTFSFSEKYALLSLFSSVLGRNSGRIIVLEHIYYKLYYKYRLCLHAKKRLT